MSRAGCEASSGGPEPATLTADTRAWYTTPLAGQGIIFYWKRLKASCYRIFKKLKQIADALILASGLYIFDAIENRQEIT